MLAQRCLELLLLDLIIAVFLSDVLVSKSECPCCCCLSGPKFSFDRCALIGKPECGRGVCVGGGGRAFYYTHIYIYIANTHKRAHRAREYSNMTGLVAVRRTCLRMGER